MAQAWSYVRFSSKPQERGDSVRRQIGLAEAYAAKHNLVLDTRSYADLGISAFKGRNKVEGALGAFLKAVDDGVIPAGAHLLVESLDRVSRAEVMDALDTFLSIVRRGIVLVTLTDEQVYTRATIQENWTKLIMALAVMARANEESATKARRVKEAWDNKRQSGKILTAVGPAWLKLSDDRKRWLEVPDKVSAVQRAFELAAKGIGTPTIADKLNEEHITTMGRAEFWEPALVMALLKNKSVIGVFTPKKAKDADPIEGYYPAIIKAEVFYQVQEHIANRRRTGGRKGQDVANLFSGLLRCECGSRMRYASVNKPHVYLQCVKAYSGRGCDAPTMPYKAIEQWVLFVLMQVEEIDFGLSEKVVMDPMAVVRAEIEDKQRLINRMNDALLHGDAAALPTLVANMTRLELEKAALEKQVRDFIPPRPTNEVLAEVFELFNRHKSVQEGTLERFELRQQLQSSLKRLLNKMVLLKDTHRSGKHEYRTAVLYGPVIEHLKEHSKFHNLWELLDDGGLAIDYQLPAWGINGTRRRKTAK